MWRQSAGKVGVCHPVLPFSPSANHLLYSLGEYTSFVIVCNSFCALRQRWVIPLPPLQNPAFTNPDSFFSHIRTVFIRFPSLEFWGIVVFRNVVFLALSFSSNIPQCLSRARVTVNSMGETPVPPFFFSGALTPGEGPLFQNKHSFYTPSSLFVKGERGFRPPSFFLWAFSLNVFLFQLGGHCTSVNLICTLIITSNVISTPS